MAVDCEPQGTWGVVLAGSYPNARLLFDRLRPRPLLPIAQRPIISYPMRWLAGAGVRGITVCTSGPSASLRRVVTDEAGASLPLAFQEDGTPRGTAGSARDAALATDARTFLVVNGTAIPDVDAGSLLRAHAVSGAAVTVVVRQGSDAQGRGLSPLGIYIFDRGAFDHVSLDGFQDIKETLLPRLHAAGLLVVTHEAGGALSRVLSTETYLAANERMIPLAIEEARDGDFHRTGSALVHASARISPRTRLVGPVIIGAEVRVEDGATLVGPSAIGAGGFVGSGTVLSRSVAWDHCVIGPGGLLDRCLLTDGAVVEPGARLYGAVKTGATRTTRTGTPLSFVRRAKDRAAAAAVAATFRVRSA